MQFKPLRPLRAIQHFLALESAGGLILFAAALAAVVLDNSALAGQYNGFVNAPVRFSIGDFVVNAPLLLWVNDGLMAVFFLLVGLEIKREIADGELSSTAQMMMPLVAAMVGMMVPGLIYVAVNWHHPQALIGWAIPAATDIAFALGVLSLLGRRVPLSLRVFLAAVAIFDDLGAIAIIAVFYTADLSLPALAAAGGVLLGLFVLNRLRVRRLTPYVLLGLLLWLLVLKSGVHATLAGVALAMVIPLGNGAAATAAPTIEQQGSPLHRLEHALHPWVAFGVLPLFGFANAGVSFAGMTPATWLEPVTLGILLGLFLGKQIAIFSTVRLFVGLRLAPMLDGADWKALYGVSVLCGIGFTMSLFIGGLAFTSDDFTQQVRHGVIGASVLSALLGYLVLRISCRVSPPRLSGEPAHDRSVAGPTMHR